MTNAVVMNFTANALLAAGAAPAMVDVPGEAGVFARAAAAVLVNLGTPHAEQRQAMTEAVPAAVEASTPWVLDPVAVGSLPVRTELAGRLLAYRPTAIRGNASEIMALAGGGAGGRGVDAVNAVDDALGAARELAARHDSVVAVSGPTDVITDGQTDLRLSNGDELLTALTGGGCALGALIGAFVAANPSRRLHAVAAATAVYTIAAEMAAGGTPGPGTFAARLLDALNRIDQTSIAARAIIA